jgi:hypothetical protein
MSPARALRLRSVAPHRTYRFTYRCHCLSPTKIEKAAYRCPLSCCNYATWRIRLTHASANLFFSVLSVPPDEWTRRLAVAATHLPPNLIQNFFFRSGLVLLTGLEYLCLRRWKCLGQS